MATYAVGDVQGCYDALLRLLEKLHFSDSDQLWLAGDLVNRGPHSLETLEFIKQLGSRAKCVLGNHDLHLLAVFHNNCHGKGKDTLDPVLNSSRSEELLHWLQQQPLLLEDLAGDYVMTHAGLPPCWSIADARHYAREVEAVLQSPQAGEYFNQMYGNQPALWQSDLTGLTRLRVITNYLTRMRFCTAAGELNFSHKGPAERAPQGFTPWYLLPRKNAADNHVNLIFGHWASLMGQVPVPQVFAVDTGCVWGNQLTALRLDDQQYISVPGLKTQSATE
ncbi:symmetrical bis(5'-nucleosyl)-tetraphosphatase [Pontibacter sp. JAM-7]|uniref:symmetrical bis(5'-nucleosyl)-tetraphosphatase n=1 Tax=Pontibacter sp. JAM-7 TaxID=3366581 RepID=UPI003AF5C5F1